MNKSITPLVCISTGFTAGVVASAAQTAFFTVTSPLKPEKPKNAFCPPEAEQKSEQETETVARRTVENFSQQGPLTAKQKKIGGNVVHYSFGGGWGVIYGLAAESFPEEVLSPVGALVFGAAVWMLSDNVLLPAVKLSADATKVPAKNHAYALAAHLIYGLAVYGTYQGAKRLLTAGQRSLTKNDLLKDDQFQAA